MTSFLLLGGAYLATLADMAAYGLLVVPGYVREVNPLVAALSPSAALGSRVAALVILAAFAVVAELVAWRPLTAVVRILLIAAIAVGVIGTAATLGAIA